MSGEGFDLNSLLISLRDYLQAVKIGIEGAGVDSLVGLFIYYLKNDGEYRLNISKKPVKTTASSIPRL